MPGCELRTRDERLQCTDRPRDVAQQLQLYASVVTHVLRDCGCACLHECDYACLTRVCVCVWHVPQNVMAQSCVV